MLAEWRLLSLGGTFFMIIRKDLVQNFQVAGNFEIVAEGNDAPVKNIAMGAVSPDIRVAVEHPPLRPSTIRVLV